MWQRLRCNGPCREVVQVMAIPPADPATYVCGRCALAPTPAPLRALPRNQPVPGQRDLLQLLGPTAADMAPAGPTAAERQAFLDKLRGM